MSVLDSDGDGDNGLKALAELITPQPCKKQERKPATAGKDGGGKPEPGKPAPPSADDDDYS
jgi:hypothetical protein